MITVPNGECFDVIIIGGGAAGLMASYAAAAEGKSTLVIERNSICGKKINISGKGRCNVTNNCSVDEFLQNVPVNPKFLFKALYAFPPSAVMDFFTEAGVPLVTERGRRVFPESGNAKDISAALSEKACEAGAKILTERVKSIVIKDGTVRGVECAGGSTITARSVVIATGGKSYPATGSTGDGYAFASRAGHTIVSPRPSLVPLVSEDPICRECMGLSLKNVEASFYSGDKLIYSEFGEMLFTHFGVSGPIVLSASAHLKSTDFPVTMNIDLKPALDIPTLDKRILKDFEEEKNRDFQNSLDKLLPKSIIPAIIKLSGISPVEKVNSIRKNDRTKLVSLLKSVPVTITGTRPIEEAVVTSGGVSVKEINPSTMESKIIKGLYFAGEVIDYDCYTGGYNLQAAFSTGFLCGINC